MRTSRASANHHLSRFAPPTKHKTRANAVLTRVWEGIWLIQFGRGCVPCEPGFAPRRWAGPALVPPVLGFGQEGPLSPRGAIAIMQGWQRWAQL
ncbi:Hypothetical Protein RRSL_00643 [Ralstonia solanacearum UW551]|uniref:Uncharacterized protein n=1 Tax=Ralstonia solanacearum (strain UW551) TaxID=342110 RepID=A0AB33VAD4_RALSU|nr:Hypothetical Protein RRSL_00643 [Ralstonia solanacearum UW551]